MATEFSWNAPASAVNWIDSTGSSGDGGGADLKNLASGSYVIAAVQTPPTPRPQYISFLCKAKLASATSVASTAFLKGWFLDKTDGTNYLSNSGTVLPAEAPDFVIYWPSYANAGGFYLRSTPRLIQYPPWPCKLLLLQGSGQATTNVNNDNVLYGVTVDELGT